VCRWCEGMPPPPPPPAPAPQLLHAWPSRKSALQLYACWNLEVVREVFEGDRRLHVMQVRDLASGVV
jgi:hypothetical protein